MVEINKTNKDRDGIFYFIQKRHMNLPISMVHSTDLKMYMEKKYQKR